MVLLTPSATFEVPTTSKVIDLAAALSLATTHICPVNPPACIITPVRAAAGLSSATPTPLVVMVPPPPGSPGPPDGNTIVPFTLNEVAAYQRLVLLSHTNKRLCRP